MPFLGKGVALLVALAVLGGIVAPMSDLHRMAREPDSEHVSRIGIELEPGGVTAQIGIELEPGG